jgi:sarcosine oxidase subunit beta
VTRRYSFLSIAREALRGHRGWEPAWRKADLRDHYDIVIIGGGGHGLATAYYLAAEFGITNVCVIEKDWIGGGNTGRNTTIIRSNYLQPESMALYGLSHKLYEGLTQELGLNVMFSGRGLVGLAQTRHELDQLTRIADANRHFGIDSWLIPPQEIRKHVPILAPDSESRYPLLGALYQPRGGTARHDAVAWGYARGASRLGVDIVENCDVTHLVTTGDTVTGVATTRGTILAGKVAVVAAAATAGIVGTAGVQIPLRAQTLQALVSEPIKPVLDVVVMAGAVHGYVSQSDKGELVIGGGTDAQIDHTRRGAPPRIEESAAAMVELFPTFARLKMMRQWAGTVDMTSDRSPLIGPAGPSNLWLNCGWGTGGFKAIPGSGYVFAASLANDRPHPIAAPFGLDRFVEGRVIDEDAAAAVAH